MRGHSYLLYHTKAKKETKIFTYSVEPQITNTGRKLGPLFQTNNQTIFEHKHDVIYHGKCPTENIIADYIGETVFS